METREFFEALEKNFGKAIHPIEDQNGGKFISIGVERDSLKKVLEFCAADSSLRFDFLENMIGIDAGQELQIIYRLVSLSLVHTLNLKVSVDRHSPKMPSAHETWKAAIYYELEIAEMLGISFQGHPEPRKLLLPEDWQGFPLRKDYTFPEEYHSIEHRRAPLRKEHTRP
ncbi:MAG: NADH-quinone oxidoreductase subunit C [Bdellovibrionota bacterium]